ncbi:MAG: hypothetical protein HY717_00780 [Planctomycetes bacterium]|nr:hypothetical protein [Planctomycetota bacterium]
MSSIRFLVVLIVLGTWTLLNAHEQILTALFSPEAGPNQYTVEFPPELGGMTLFLPITGGRFTLELNDEAHEARLLGWEQKVAPVEIVGLSSGDITVRIDSTQPSSGTYEASSGYFEVSATFILEFDDTQLRELGFFSPFILEGTEKGTIYGVGDIGTVRMVLEGSGSVGLGAFKYKCETSARFEYRLPENLAQAGDVNHDHNHDVSDPIGMLLFLFLGEPLACEAAFEVNRDGSQDISDPIFLLSYLYLSGPKPPADPVTCN